MSSDDVILVLMAAGVVIAVACGFFGYQKYQRELKEWKEKWLRLPISRNPQCAEIEGEWTGSFSYSGNTNHVPDTEGSFKASFSEHDGAIAGDITDIVGRSKVTGVIKYPSVHFQKEYIEKYHPLGRVGSVMYYEGRITPDGTAMTGEWFQLPLHRKTWCGTWRMTRTGGASQMGQHGET
jgi:hypothetical protein